MNDVKKSTTSVNLEVPTIENIAGRRTLIPVCFAAVIVLFFFSFADFKCNGKTAASITGFNLVTGTHIQTPASAFDNSRLFDEYDGTSTRKPTIDAGEKIDPNLWAILAFIAAITGVVVFWRKEKKEALYGTALGAVGFLALIILRSVIKSKVEAQGAMLQIETDFTFAYWLCVLAFIVAGALSYLRLTNRHNEEAQTGSSGVSNLNVYISSSADRQKEENRND
ncbi:MAG: hypothetical protein ACTHJ5_02290 [Ilyomonas sp.]